MAAPQITILPAAPNPSDSTKKFNQDAYAFTVAQQNNSVEMNSLVEWLNENVSARPVSVKSTESSSIDPEDSGSYIRFTFSGAKSLTVNPESVVAQIEGASYFIANKNNGDLTIIAGSGVTINGNVALAQNAAAFIQRIASNTYDLIPIGGDFLTDLENRVIGPGSSANDQVALFDGIAGTLIKAGLTMDQYLDSRTIENVAALSSFSPIVGKNYYLKEYNAGTGVGGGEVVGKAGVITPNNVTTFACTTGTYVERINYSEIDITFAGFYPGQSSPITAQVQSCVDATQSNGTVKVVTIPAGDWLSDTIYLKRGVTLKGAGKGVTNLYQSVIPVTQGMVRADKENDASNTKVIGISFYGNGKIPSNPALLKAVFFQEVKNFECRDCSAHNFSSYGFWAHTPATSAIEDMCENGLFIDCETSNVEHAFETKRAKNIRWVRCVAHGNAEYSQSAFHPWERSENIRYEQCEAYGDFNESAINTIGSNDPGTEGNNKNLLFDVYVELNAGEDALAANRCARIYRADDVVIVGKMTGLSGILWGGGSGSLTLNSELNATLSGLVSSASEIANGTLSGSLTVNLNRERGVGLIADSAFLVEQNGSKSIDMEKLTVNYSADGGIEPIRIYDVDSEIKGISGTGVSKVIGVYYSQLISNDITIASAEGANPAVYSDNSHITGRLVSTGFAPIVAESSTINVDFGSEFSGRISVTLQGSSKLIGSAKILSDATNTNNVAYAVSLQGTSYIGLVNSDLSLINGGTLTSDDSLIRTNTATKLNLNSCRLSSSQSNPQVSLNAPNNIIVGCDTIGIAFSLQATANKSALIGNTVAFATLNTSTGSVITEIIK